MTSINAILARWLSPCGPKLVSVASRWPPTLGIMLILAFGAAGCGSEEDVNPPALIDTTVTPAAIIVPTGGLAQPETVSRDLAAALAKTRTATVYRISFDFETGTGEPG